MKSCSLDDRVTLLSQVNARAATDTSDVLREKVEALERRRCPSPTKQMQGTGAGMGTRGSEKRLQRSRSQGKAIQEVRGDACSGRSQIPTQKRAESKSFPRACSDSSCIPQHCFAVCSKGGVAYRDCGVSNRPSVLFHHLRRCPWIRFEAAQSVLIWSSSCRSSGTWSQERQRHLQIKGSFRSSCAKWCQNTVIRTNGSFRCFAVGRDMDQGRSESYS